MTDVAVTVIVPVYNGLHVVRPCHESIQRWTDLGRHRVMFVNDGSDDRTSNELAQWARQRSAVDVLVNDRNVGFVRSCNRAMKLCQSDYVLLLNSDTCVTPRWLDKMVAAMESDRNIGVASPISNFAPHLKIPMLPGMDYLQMNALVECHSLRSYPDVTTPEGFCFMISRRCLEVIGYFDEVFDSGYGEESDLSMRAVYHGFRTVCVDDTYIYHRGRGTFGEERRNQMYERNKAIFFARWKNRYATDFDAFQARDPLDYLRQALGAYRSDGIHGAYARG